VWVAVEVQVARLNRLLTGWSNYFRLGAVTAAYRAVDYRVRGRLRQWLCRKHAVGTRGAYRFPDQHLYDELGLVRLCARGRRASRGRRGDSWSESRMREIRPSGSMSGRWKRSRVCGPEPRKVNRTPGHTAT
jgi:hypothetical protein